MTKTQANEPGLLPVPHTSLESAQKAIGRLYGIADALEEGPIGLSGDIRRNATVVFAALASAPLVPSPAYGGVREALEPFLAFTSFPAFESLPDSFVVTKGSPIAGPQLTVGDLRRPRAAYEAISHVAVEEADAKAAAWRDMATAPKDGTLIVLLVRPFHDDEEGGWTPFEDSRDPQPTIGFNSFDHTEENRWQFAGWDWSQDCIIEGQGEIIGWLPFTPSPQIGKAGAGPVGEAVERATCDTCQGNGEVVTDWDCYLHAREGDKGDEAVAECPDCSGEGTRPFEEPAGPVGDAVLEAAWQAFGDCPVDMCGDHDTEQRKCVDAAVVAAFAARPVEEPGEVERLTRERDEALERVDELEAEGERVSVEFEKDCWIAMRALLNQCKFDWSHVDINGVQAEEAREFVSEYLKTAEAALAETRERLEKMRSALVQIEGGHFPGAVDVAISGSWQVAVNQLQGIARAALTGDAREAGR